MLTTRCSFGAGGGDDPLDFSLLTLLSPGATSRRVFLHTRNIMDDTARAGVFLKGGGNGNGNTLINRNGKKEDALGQAAAEEPEELFSFSSGSAPSSEPHLSDVASRSDLSFSASEFSQNAPPTASATASASGGSSRSYGHGRRSGASSSKFSGGGGGSGGGGSHHQPTLEELLAASLARNNSNAHAKKKEGGGASHHSGASLGRPSFHSHSDPVDPGSAPDEYLDDFYDVGVPFDNVTASVCTGENAHLKWEMYDRMKSLYKSLGINNRDTEIDGGLARDDPDDLIKPTPRSMTATEQDVDADVDVDVDDNRNHRDDSEHHSSEHDEGNAGAESPSHNLEGKTLATGIKRKFQIITPFFSLFSLLLIHVLFEWNIEHIEHPQLTNNISPPFFPFLFLKSFTQPWEMQLG